MPTGTGGAPARDDQSPQGSVWALDETVLALIMGHAPLAQSLNALCLGIEGRHPGLLCSVLLLDRDGVTMRTGAAPSLPGEYSQAIDGAKIGPCVGSCGTAAYRKEAIIVSDIATDALWVDFRTLALSFGLRACWSTPIPAQDGAVLGTFAVYYREPRSPDPHHFQSIAHATHLAGIAIERDRARLQLRAAEDRYRTLVERLPAITYVAELGASGPWHYVSPQIESILGFTPAEWLADSNSWINHVLGEDREIVLAAERRFQDTHELFQAEYRLLSKDGRILWFRDEGVMLHEANDRTLLMQGVMYDITSHKRLEEQLRHSQKMEAVGQLAGGVAHDFNNLLMLIQAHNERLRERLSPGDSAHEDAREIEQAVTRAASLTRQLLAFSRKQVLHAKVLNLNEVMGGVVKMLDRLITNNIEVRTVHDLSLGSMKADPSQVEQVILNLAVNARDAMPGGGRLLLETKNVEVDEAYACSREGVAPGVYVMLIVRDTGVGMDTDTQSRIFEPFFTTKAPGKGTGLGLATVYGVVKQMGGAIWVESKLGIGTTFEIYFPRVEAAEKARSPERGSLSSTPTGNETVLLVEDQDGIRDLVREFLSRKGYKVLQAMDGNDALKIAAANPDKIHLLLTDVVMPNIGGRELARRISQSWPGIKVLFMSGYPEHVTLSGETHVEGAAVLQKPFPLDALARKVRSVLDERESG